MGSEESLSWAGSQVHRGYWLPAMHMAASPAYINLGRLSLYVGTFSRRTPGMSQVSSGQIFGHLSVKSDSIYRS